MPFHQWHEWSSTLSPCSHPRPGIEVASHDVTIHDPRISVSAIFCILQLQGTRLHLSDSRMTKMLVFRVFCKPRIKEFSFTLCDKRSSNFAAPSSLHCEGGRVITQELKFSVTTSRTTWTRSKLVDTQSYNFLEILT